MKFELDRDLVQRFLDNFTSPPYEEVEELAGELRRLLLEEGEQTGMQVFNVGPEEICIPIGDPYDWLVYWYQSGSYEGDGVAAYKKDGKFGWANLGHCSCYGPEEQLGLAEMDIVSLIQDLTTNNGDYDHDRMAPVKAKVIELEFVDWETAKEGLGL